MKSSNRLAIITGAGKGIGRACVSQFISNGFSVAVFTRSESDLVSIKKEAKKRGVECLAFSGDASNKNDVQSFFEKVDKKFSQIDVLVNNAGVFLSDSFLDMSFNLFQSQWKNNTLSTFLMSQQAAKRMIEKKSGQIINIVSVAAKRSFEGSSAYCSSKFAQDGLAKVMRDELKQFNIRITNVYPGAAFTNSWSGSDVDPNRLMSAEDVAAVIFNTVILDKNCVIEEIVLRPVLGDL